VSDNPFCITFKQLCLPRGLDLILTQPHFQVGHIIPAHVSYAVSSSQNMLLVNQRSSAKLTTIVEQGSNPGPLVLVSWPSIDNSEGVLACNSLVFLSHAPIDIVADGVVLTHPTSFRNIWV